MNNNNPSDIPNPQINTPKIKVNRQPVKIVDRTDEENLLLIEQGQNPEEFVTVECCALGIQAQPQEARIKGMEGDVQHKCVPFVIQIVVPIEAKDVFKTSLYVSPTQQANGAIQKAVPAPPIARVLLKKEFVTDTLLKEHHINKSQVEESDLLSSLNWDFEQDQ